MANLLPTQQRKAVTREEHLRLLVFALFFLLLAGLLAIIALVPSLFLAYSKQKEVTSRIASLEMLLERRQEQDVSAEVRMARDELKALNSILTHGSPTETIVLVAAQAGPSVKVLSVTYEPSREVPGAGETATSTRSAATLLVRGTAATRDALLDFVKRLEREPTLEQVDLPVSNLAARTDIAFSLTLSVAVQDNKR